VASHEYRRYVLGLQSGDGEADRVVDVTLERHRVAREELAYGDTWADVRATSPVTLVLPWPISRWRATALNTTTGKSEALKVSRNGLIQQVTRTEAGEWTIAFPLPRALHRTQSGRVDRGVVLIIGVGAYLIVDERRRREDKVRS